MIAERQNLEVVSDGDRDDIGPRREVKYALPGADADKLRCLLEGSCRKVTHGSGRSLVRSVYFDDFARSGCWENHLGAARRRKVRLRWYDVDAPDVLFFELKWREGVMTGKRRRRVRLDRPFPEWRYKDLVRQLSAALPSDLACVLDVRPEATSLVEYEREHFVARQGDMRLTVDRNLRFVDQTCRQRLVLRGGMQVSDLIVLEAKTPPGAEHRLRRLLAPFAPRATRSSKYVVSCETLGLTGPG